MTRIRRFLRRSRWIDGVFLALITGLLTTGWWNSGIPLGQDALGFTTAEAMREPLALYHKIPEWSSTYMLGFPISYLWPPSVPILQAALSIPLGWITAIKLIYAGFFMLSGVFAYLYVYKITRHRFASVVGGLLYVFLPFPLIEMVREGQWDITAGYMLTPLVFLWTEKSIRSPTAKNAAIASVFLALLITSHPQVFPILVGPFWITYVGFRLWMERREDSVRRSASTCASILIIGLLLTAFWWIPALAERGDLHPGYSGPLADFCPTLAQALTLRPQTGCAGSSVYSIHDPPLLQLLSWFPLALAVLGIATNRRSKLAWFFAASVLVALPMSMGTRTPLFQFLHNYSPLLSTIRTPERLLLFSSFCYAILGALGTRTAVDWGREHFKLSIALAVLLSVCVIGNTWQEYREAFGTFSLSKDQQEAIDWLSEQEEGRLMKIPLDYYLYSPELKTIDPITYRWMHGKETVYDNPFHSGFAGALRPTADHGPTVIDYPCDVLGIKYLVAYKTDPIASNYVFGASFVKVWDSKTLVIYRNEDAYPRAFITTSQSKDITLNSSDWAEISAQYANIVNSRKVKKVTYTLIQPGKYKLEFESTEPCWLILTEAYYPGWVARIDDKNMSSEQVLSGINGWYIENPGKYEVILEFTPSTQRVVTRVISILTAIALVSFFIIRYIRRRLDSRRKSITLVS